MSAAQPAPSVGEWYRYTDGDLFEVVAVDEDEGTIEIQYFDGTIEEIDAEDWAMQWHDHQIEAAAAPEDWSGSVDMDAEDKSPADWRDAR